MVPPPTVDDPTDQRVREFVGLSDAELRRGVEGTGGRHGRGIFIVEGTLAIGVLLREPQWSVRTLLVTPKKLAELDPDLVACCGAQVLVAAQAVLDAVVGFNLHRGAVASVDRPCPRGPETVVGAEQLVVLEGINDQENLGVLFRNAAALGADAVLLSPTCCDPLYRRTVRVSMGHVLSVPFAVATAWPDPLHRLHGAGYTTVALTPATSAPAVDELASDLAHRRAGGHRRVAVLLGSEGPGLSDAALSAAEHRVRIPMGPGVDSLNVAAAGAVAFHRLFEVGR